MIKNYLRAVFLSWQLENYLEILGIIQGDALCHKNKMIKLDRAMQTN
jgi:hypothetical protein